MNPQSERDPADRDPGPDVDHDPLLEAMLEEELGARRPPDLAARVLARLAQPDVAPRTAADRTAGPGPRDRRRTFWVGLGLGAAAAALAALGLGLALRPPPAVTLDVVAGAVEWRRGANLVVARAGERASWPLAARDRLRSFGERTLLGIVPLGTLTMDPNTLLEIEAMDWKPFSSGAVVGAITVAVISGAIWWSSGPGGSPARAGERLTLEPGEGGSSANARIADLTKQVAELQARLTAADLQAQELRTASRTAVLPQPHPESQPAAPEPAPVAKLAAAISYSGMEATLAQIDWDVTGDSMRKMVPMLEQLATAVLETGEVPLSLAGELQKLNAGLISQCDALVKNDVPGTGINGKFTHPVIAANQMHATLTKAGIPLSAEQARTLQALSARYAAEDDQVRASAGSDATAIEKLAAEMEIKDRFYKDAGALLSAEQKNMLWPEATRGRNGGDLFSPGLIAHPLMMMNQTIVADRGELVQNVTDRIGSTLRLDKPRAEKLERIVQGWAKSIPDSEWNESATKLDEIGFTKTERVIAATKRQAQMVRRIMTELDLDPATRAKVQKELRLIVPLRKGS